MPAANMYVYALFEIVFKGPHYFKNTRVGIGLACMRDMFSPLLNIVDDMISQVRIWYIFAVSTVTHALMVNIYCM